MRLIHVDIYNVPYNESSLNVPISSRIPYTWVVIASMDVNRSFNFGSVINLNIPFDQIRNANYIAMKIEFTDAIETQEIYYAWIDNISESTYLDENKIKKQGVRIEFHRDHWRTFIDRVDINYGVIKNRRPSNNDPPQIVPSIHEQFFTFVHEIKGQYKGIAWIYLAYAKNSALIRVAFPVDINNFDQNIFYNDGDKKLFPSFSDVIKGNILKFLKVDSSKLINCYISSIAPVGCHFKDGYLILDDDFTKDAKEITLNEDFVESYTNGEVKVKNNTEIIDFGNLRAFGGKDDNPQLLERMRYYAFPSGEIKEKLPNHVHKRYLQIETKGEQYLPLLQYLKRFNSLGLPKTIHFVTNDAYYGTTTFKWIGAFAYRREFDIKTDRHIQSLVQSNDNPDNYTAHFNTGDDKEVTLLDVWLKRRNDPYKMVFNANRSLDIKVNKVEDGDYYVMKNDIGVWPEVSYTFGNDIKSTPLNNVYLTDNYGYPISKFKQGITIKNYTVQVITTSVINKILIRFNTKMGYIDNTEFAMDLSPMEIASTYMNEYILSGQKTNADEARQQNILDSLLNIGTNVIGGAAVGSIIPGFGTITGAVGGGLMGLMNTGTSAFTGQMHQENAERAIARKGSLLIRPPGDYSWIHNGFQVSLCISSIDGYSQNLYFNKIEYYGIDCNEIDPDGSVSYDLLKSDIGGPLRIDDLRIVGYIPSNSKEYIKNRLNNGVYLDPELSIPLNEDENDS